MKARVRARCSVRVASGLELFTQCGGSGAPSASERRYSRLASSSTGSAYPCHEEGCCNQQDNAACVSGDGPSREQGWHGGDRARSRLLFGQRDDLGAIDGYLLVGLRAVGQAHAAWCLKAEHPQLWRGVSLRRHQAGRSGGAVKHGRRPFQPAAPPRQTSSKRAGASACESTSWSREYTLSALSGRRQRMPQ